MFIPNATCRLYRHTNIKDLYGAYVFDAPVTVRCSVISLDLKVAKTSVRVDSSASRGRAEEEVGLATLLFLPNTQITEGDVVQVDGQVLEVIRLFPRRDVLGKVDHITVDLRKGALPA